VFKSNMDILALSLDFHFNEMFPNMGKKRRSKQASPEAPASSEAPATP
jgi:hypothetical protein